MTEKQPKKKAAKKLQTYEVVEIAGIDPTALPGQPQLVGMAALVKKGNRIIHYRYHSQEWQVANTYLEAQVANVNAKGGDPKGFWQYLQERGLAGRLSTSLVQTIKAPNIGSLPAVLRKHGFNISREEG